MSCKRMCVVGVVLLISAGRAFAYAGQDDARDLLTNAKPRGSIEADVQGRLCYAGRFQVESVDKSERFCAGKFVEQVASAEDHPNAKPLGEVRLLLGGEDSHVAEEGKVYCLIITHGSRVGMTLVAFGKDTPETFQEVKNVIQSAQAFQNSPTWKKRRALWKGFMRDSKHIPPGAALSDRRSHSASGTLEKA